MTPGSTGTRMAADAAIAPRQSGRALTLLRVRGIPLRIHWTLVLMLFYLTWVLSLQFEKLAQQAGPGSLSPLSWGAVLAVSLFVGVFLHELGHSLVARIYGARVRAITLT